MGSIIKISEATSLALHTVVYLSGHPGQLVSTREIAKALHASEAHLSKVLQRLARVGIVKSIRGPKGGFTLAKSPADITLLQIYEEIEGPIDDNVCLTETEVCLGKGCILGNLLESCQSQVKKHLAKTTVSKLTHVFTQS
jgi:Rrf2 family protein